MRTARRQTILVGAGRLFSEQGVSATTVRQIADAAGILSGSLYHYFPAKESIASEILVDFLEDLAQEYTQIRTGSRSTRERITRLVGASLRVAALHPYATEIYHREVARLDDLPAHEAIAGMVAANYDMWQTLVDDGVAAGEVRADLSREVVLRTMSELIWLTVRWNRASLEQCHDELSRRLVTLLFDGVALHNS